jgi:methylmalonyl-CoA mutase N-terminal domain/subunit
MLEGVLREVESGWFQREIADAAYELERKVNDGRHLVVGVNTAREGNDEPPPEILRIGPEVEELQLKRLAQVRADRDDERVRTALDAVRAAAGDPTTNVMPALIDAVDVYATEGEVMDALADVFGRYVETPVL